MVSSFKCQSLSLRSTLFEIQGKGRRRGKVRKKEIEGRKLKRKTRRESDKEKRKKIERNIM